MRAIPSHRAPASQAFAVVKHVTVVKFADMQLNLPEAVESRLSPSEAALHLAIGMFVTEEATLGQAAEIAGTTQARFLKELGRRRIPVHYGRDELADDLKTVESFGRE